MRVLMIVTIVLTCAGSSFGEGPAAKGEKGLKVLSNNIGVFPPFVLALYPENVKEKKTAVIADEEERAAQLARALIEFDGDPDVVLLQEIWSIKARDRLIKDLSQKYPYCKHPQTIGAGATALQASGLMVFSKYPLEDFAFKEFTNGIGGDKAARKGIVGVRLTKNERHAAVFTTHLQAGGKRDPSVKPDQLRECNEFMRKFVDDREDEIVVLAGDFNIRSTEREAYDEIFVHLEGAHDSYQERLGPLTTTTRNEKQPKKRIDYLLTFGDVEAASTIVDVAGPRISDHLAIFGTVPLDGKTSPSEER